MNRAFLRLGLAACLSSAAEAQAPGKWPPDSLINTRIISRNTPPIQVWGQMRTISFSLGVACQFCHVGDPGAPLERIDYATDQKRTKLVARQMMRLVRDINAKLDSIPDRPAPSVAVNCMTCHRGVSRPIPLATVIAEAALAADADSAIRAYRALRDRYYGSDSYDFSEFSLNSAAFRVSREGKPDAALAMLRLNEQFHPRSSAISVVRGNVLLSRGDTTGAAASFREAIQRDSTNDEARGRLRAIGIRP
jgi:hypothetical protein